MGVGLGGQAGVGVGGIIQGMGGLWKTMNKYVELWGMGI